MKKPTIIACIVSGVAAFALLLGFILKLKNSKN